MLRFAAEFAQFQRLRHQTVRFFDRRHLSSEELAEALRDAGMVSGATVMVHSSMDEIARRVPGRDARQLVRLLQQLLGEDGTLLMPTFPFTGRQWHYVQSHHSFDPLRTPSHSGLLTEVFRRCPGVRRSLHPTHPVAAWGCHAEALLASHHLGGAFAETSPFYRLQMCGGIVIGIGVRLSQSFAIIHVAEEIHPRIRQVVLDPIPKNMEIVQASGTMPYVLYPFREDVRRNLRKLERRLTGDGVLRHVRRGGLSIATASAQEVIRYVLEALESGYYFSGAPPAGGRS